MPAKKRAKRPTLKERRAEKRAVIEETLETLTLQLKEVRQSIKQISLLTSVADGLYEELDKLAKKAPVDQATVLVVEHANDLIKEAREIAPDDPYMQRIKQFVPAGDNPEHRDVVLILKQLHQGLDRCLKAQADRQETLVLHVDTAKGLIIALELYLHYDATYPSTDQLEANDVSLPDKWLSGPYNNKHVDLDRIDRLDVESYFGDDE